MGIILFLNYTFLWVDYDSNSRNFLVYIYLRIPTIYFECLMKILWNATFWVSVSLVYFFWVPFFLLFQFPFHFFRTSLGIGKRHFLLSIWVESNRPGQEDSDYLETIGIDGHLSDTENLKFCVCRNVRLG